MEDKMFDLKKIDLEDEDIYKIISDKKTKGLFQAGSHLVKHWAGKIKPANLGELSDLIAIIRPSSLNFAQDYVDVKNGETTPKYVDDRLETILSPSKGIILYQESIIKMIQELANETESYSDSIRKCIGKKDLDKLKKELPKIKEKFIKNGMKEEAAELLIQMISYSGSYAFNKSHSLVYAVNLAYTAYLKSHFPIAFFYSNLVYAKEKQQPLDEIRELYYDAKDFGIDIIPPSIKNISEEFEIVDNKTISYGFMHIKGMGKTGIKQLKKIANISDWPSFLKNALENKVKKNVIEAIIKCGVLDYFNIPRCKLLFEYEIVNALTAKQQEVFLGKYDGDLYSAVVAIPEDNKRLRVNEEILKKLEEYKRKIFFDYLTTKDIWEREFLGINISSSRLDEYNEEDISHNLSMINSALDGEEIVVIALLEKIKKTKTRKNKEDMAFLTLSDLSAVISNCIVFPKLYQSALYKKGILKEDGEVLKITGYKSINDRGESFIATDLEKLG